MRKMPTLFKRAFVGSNITHCLNEVTPNCEWVINGEGYPTEKIDGTCCLIKDNQIYRRYDLLPGRTLPTNAIPCQDKPDPITNHFPHWVLCCETNPNDRYHLIAFHAKDNWEDGTYELIGKHFNANPYNLENDVLEKHGLRILEGVPKTYEGIKEYLKNHYIEGIVFYRGNVEMCKIKRSDFGYDWKTPKEHRDIKRKEEM